MSKPSKIEKYNLIDEFKQLYNLEYGNEEIARILKDNHSEIEELQNLSGMSVGRFKKRYEESLMESDIKLGKDPFEEFSTVARDIYDKIETLYDKSLKILDDVEQNGNDALRLKAVKEARDSLKEMLKTRESMIQFGEEKIETAKNLNMKKEYNIKIMLLNISKSLCPQCRKELSKVLEMED